jgi:hypothetical protein
VAFVEENEEMGVNEGNVEDADDGVNDDED